MAKFPKLTNRDVLIALTLATDEQIASEHARRNSNRRQKKSGGSTWAHHNPGAKKGCRCASCKQWRTAEVAAATAHIVVV